MHNYEMFNMYSALNSCSYTYIHFSRIYKKIIHFRTSMSKKKKLYFHCNSVRIIQCVSESANIHHAACDLKLLGHHAFYHRFNPLFWSQTCSDIAIELFL